MQRGSVEYLDFTLTDRDGKDLSADTVSVAVVAHATDLPTATWLPCTSLGAGKWRTTSVVTWTTANYPESAYLVYAKVGDSPETPLTRLGRVNVTA